MINYIQDFFPEAYAGDFSSQLSQPGAALLGTSGIWFRDSGSAY